MEERTRKEPASGSTQTSRTKSQNTLLVLGLVMLLVGLVIVALAALPYDYHEWVSAPHGSYAYLPLYVSSGGELSIAYETSSENVHMCVMAEDQFTSLQSGMPWRCEYLEEKSSGSFVFRPSRSGMYYVVLNPWGGGVHATVTLRVTGVNIPRAIVGILVAIPGLAVFALGLLLGRVGPQQKPSALTPADATPSPRQPSPPNGGESGPRQS